MTGDLSAEGDGLGTGSPPSHDSQEHVMAELVALRRRKVALLEECNQHQSSFGLLRYEPHKKQDAFHRAGAFKRRGAFWGNRTGKSHMGCSEDAAWLMGERVWYPRSDPSRYIGIPKHPVKLLLITTDWDKMDEIWTSQRGDSPGKMWKVLPKDGFVKSTKRNHAGVIDTIECHNGSLFRADVVEAWKRNPKGSESSDWDAIHIDEPCPHKMWLGVSRGLVDRNGSAWFTLTALEEPWIIDDFFPKVRDVKCLPMEYTSGNRWVSRASIYDNPHISKEGVKEFERDLTEDERECRLLGIPMQFTGLVYKAFSWEDHVPQSLPYYTTPAGLSAQWNAWNDPPRHFSIYLHIDPHPQTPHAVLFCAIDELGRKYFYDEIFKHVRISELCAMIREKVKGRNVIRVKCDPTAWINDPITGETMAYEFHKHGILVEKATKALALGVMAVQDELQKPHNLFVSPVLQEFHYEIQRYVWDKDKDKNKDRPKDENDHMMEGLYRLILDNMVYVEPPSPERNTPIGDEEITSPNFQSDERTIIDFD